jgi:hypothetical protein
VRWDAFGNKADMPPLSAIFPLSGDCVAKQFCPSERAVDVVAKSPPQHRTRVGKPRQGNKEKTRKKRDA